MKQPEALRLADILQHKIPSIECLERAAEELRRLHGTNQNLLEKNQNLFSALMESTAQKDALHEENKALRADPALHFCQQFEAMLERMASSLLCPDSVADEVIELLSDYNTAQHKWREMMGEPYVSGFGSD